MNGYLQPMNALGFAAFTQAAEAAGWYQFDTPHRNPLLPAITGITIPPDAQGFMLQAKADLHYMFSPTGAVAGATGSFTLPAGGYAFFPGADSLARFCMLMPASGAQFVVSFYSGSIGPIPMLNIPDTGGVTPPPPPGGAAVITTNVVHVMKADGAFGGNDGTGTRNRLDLPFLTITAAQAVALPGDIIMVWAGTYNEGDLGVNGVIYFRLGAAIIADDNFGAVFVDNGGASFEVRGWGQIAKTVSGTAVSADNGGTLVVDGDITSEDRGVYVAGTSTITINGSISAFTEGAVCNRGTLTVTGSTLSYSSYGAWTSHANAELHIGGNATSSTNYGAVADLGNLRVDGNAVLEATGSGNAAYAGAGAVLHVMGNAINLGGGAACSTTMPGAELYVHGEARNVSGACCRATDGYIKVFGDAYSETERAVLAQGGTVEVLGTAISDAYLAVDINAGGTCILWGGATTNLAASATINLTDATDTLVLRGAAYVRNDGSGNAIDNPLGTGGVVNSYGAYGAAPAAGTLTLNGTYTVL